jgi:hypothetical protein
LHPIFTAHKFSSKQSFAQMKESCRIIIKKENLSPFSAFYCTYKTIELSHMMLIDA